MEYKINLCGRCDCFTVPSAITDNYLKTANTDALKVLLYILRIGGNFEEVIVSREKIEKATKINDIQAALEFWSDANVFEITDDGNITCGEIYRQTEIQKRAEVKKITALEHDFEPTPKDLADGIAKNKAIEKIYFKYEEIKGKDLTFTDKKLVAAITESGLPYEIIMILLEYCKKMNITRPQNIKKTAQDWLENGIDTAMKAEEEIKSRIKYNEQEKLVLQALELHEFSDSQKEYVKKWLNVYGFDYNMIYDAKQTALDNGVKTKVFNYMDRVLENRHKQGFKTKEDIQKNKEKHTENYKSGNKSEPSYDLKRKARRLMEKYGDCK